MFSFTPDYPYFINADEVVYGGSGYAIRLIDGREVYDKSLDEALPYEIEHTFPDYLLYGITDTAYGFITRGCPRGCDFCHIQNMQGKQSVRVASLDEFWNGQKNIVLLDPNLTACKNWKEIFQVLIDTGSYIDFSQGLDLRLLNDEKLGYLQKMKIKRVHFAWDRIEDKEFMVPKLKWFKEKTEWSRGKIVVYVLVGNKEKRILPEDLERVYTLREIGCDPYIMIYDKDSIPRKHELRDFQRWVNNRFIWGNCRSFEDYERRNK